jgi:GGDEF domain-containing protein
LGSWEETTSTFLDTFRLHSIKSKILVFALLATLIPSLTMGWLSYVQNKRSLTEKITEELRNVTSHTAREIDLWLKERFYDVRVFSSSYEVSENLEKILRDQGATGKEGKAFRRLKDYLKSVRAKFVDYEELLVIDQKAQVVATTARRPGHVTLPPGWLNLAKKDEIILGEAHWDEALKKVGMMIAVPIKAANGRFLGVLTARLNFQTIHKFLKSFSLGRSGHVYVIAQDGTLVISSQLIPSAFMKSKLAPRTTQALFKKEAASLEYTDYEGKGVVGTLKRVPQLEWAVVAEIGGKEAYAQIVRLRNLTLLMVLGLLLGIGLTAYVLGLTIVRPLDRLTKGAAKVAAGDLQVDLPVLSGGEVGYMTEVFNDMVARLHQGRDDLAAINTTLSERNRELAQLSVTDSLTGLYNRKHLMETLANEMARASKIASIFRESIRSVDYVARYGGEEFLVMLPETALNGGLESAERIRTRVAMETFGNGSKQITVSIGVAGFREHGDAPESIIASADAALYQAKRRGRNRVVRASTRREEKTKQRAKSVR